MKKISSLFIVLLLIPQMALAHIQQDFKHLVDDYLYSMTVEWDQQNLEFVKAQQNVFETELNQLMLKGLNPIDIQQALNLEESFITEIHSLDLSDSEALTHFILKQRSPGGASWNGDVIAGVLGITITTLFFGWLVVSIVKANRKFDQCVRDHGGNTDACIDRGL